MKLSRWFDKEEFACKCGCDEDFEIDPNLITVLDQVREYVGNPMTITSGYRCKKHNDSLGSTDKSQHRKGTAADVVFAYHGAQQVADIAEGIMGKKGGLGRYKDFTHIDVRKGIARWGKN